MGCAIVFAEHALDRLDGVLPEEVFSHFNDALRALAGGPRKLSRPADLPYPQRGRMYPFKRMVEQVPYYFVVFFYLSPDEQTIRVFDVTVTFPDDPA